MEASEYMHRCRLGIFSNAGMMGLFFPPVGGGGGGQRRYSQSGNDQDEMVKIKKSRVS